MAKYKVETEGGVYIIETQDAPAAQAPKDPRAKLGEAVSEFAIGAAKGLGNTAFNAARMFEGVTTLGLASAIRNKNPEAAKLDTQVREGLKPTSETQQAGYVTEQAAEFLAPMGLVGKGVKLIEGATAGVRGARALNIGGRAALEGTSAAGIAGVQTNGDPKAMAQAGLTAGAITGATGAVSQAAGPVANALKEGAKQQYARVLNATGKGNKARSQEVVPGLIERRVTAVTTKGLQNKAAAQVEKWGQAIGDEYDNLPANAAVDLMPIIQRMDDAGKDLVIQTSKGAVSKGPTADTALRNLDELKDKLLSVADMDPNTGAFTIPVKHLRDLRRYWDEVTVLAGRFEGKTLQDQSLAKAHAMAADSIREELAKAYPSIDKLNKEYSFWKDVHKVVSDTVTRREGQAAKSLGRKITEGTGAFVGAVKGGPQGAAIGKWAAGQLEELTTSAAWQTIGAVWKDKLANALAKGHQGEVEFVLRKILNTLGSSAATSNASQQRPSGPTPVPLAEPVLARAQ